MPKQRLCFLLAHRKRNLTDFIQFAVQNLARVSPSRATTAGQQDPCRCAFDNSFDEIFRGRRAGQRLIIVQHNPPTDKLVFE